METQDIQIYETFGETSDEEQQTEPDPPKSEEVESTTLSIDEATQSFLNIAYLTKESVQDKVKRIRREIEELKYSGAAFESKSLLEELNNALKPPAAANIPTKTSYQQPETGHSMESTLEFARLEKRVAKLEALIGSSVRVPVLKTPISTTLNSMQEILTLLSSDPEALNSKIKQITSQKDNEGEKVATDQQISFVYKRLTELDSEIEAIPAVISRLQTLKYVHGELVNTTDRISTLESSLSVIRQEIKAWRQCLGNMETNVQKYIAISQDNIKKLV